MVDSFLMELLTSKKVVAAVTGVLTVIAAKVAGKFGIVLDADSANQISLLVGGITSAYLISQGAADHGVTAAQITADATVQAALVQTVKVASTTAVTGEVPKA